VPRIGLSRYARILSIVGGVVGLATVLTATHRYGPGISHDSVAYLHAARSLLDGRGFEYFGYPSPYIQWPPLFPILLAAAGLLGANPASASRWLNAVGFAAIIVYGGTLLGQRLLNRLSLAVGVVLLVFAAPLIEISRYIWTETLFVLLFLGFFDTIQRYLANRRTALLLWAGLFSALAWLERYLGITVVITTVVLLIVERRPILERFKNAVLYGAVSCAPMLLWMARNYWVSGTPAGVRVRSLYTLSDNLKLLQAAFATWLPSGRLWALSAITMLVIALTAGTMFVQFAAGRLKWPDQRLTTIAVMGAFAVIYLLYLIASATRVAIEAINSRFIDPLYVPAVFVFAALADLVLSNLNETRRILYGIALALMVVAPIFWTVSTVRAAYDGGAGSYSSAEWRNNLLIRDLQARPRENCTYYSNAPDAVYAITGIHAYWPPKKSGPPMYGFEAFRKRVEQDACTYVVWFGSGPGGGLYGIEDLENLFRVELVDRNSAGAIYKLMMR
jgi:hypothetical protein